MSARSSLFAELKRRHVPHVAAAYAVVGRLLVQVAPQVFDPVRDDPHFQAALKRMGLLGSPTPENAP